MQGAQSASRHRGIGRYTLSYAKAIIRNRGEHEVILALSGLFPHTIEHMRAEFDRLLPQSNIRVWHAPGPVKECEEGNDTRRNVAELVREAFLVNLKPDIIHITSLFEGFLDDSVVSIGKLDTSTPVSIILYDLIPLVNSSQYLQNERYEKFYRKKIDLLLKCSSLHAISEFSKKEFIENFPDCNIPVSTIFAASESHFVKTKICAKDKESFLKKFDILRPFILFSGATDDRKNLPRLIESYSRLDKSLIKSHQLVLAGGIPDDHRAKFHQLAKDFNLSSYDFKMTGWVTDTDLAKLYSLCKVYIFPSWHEGFGLPPLEAMACGAPVISANTSSLPELVGYEKALFNPFDILSITNKLKEVLVDEGFRQELILNGLAQASKFSWCETAKKSIGAWINLRKNSSLTVLDVKKNWNEELLSSLPDMLKNSDDEFLLRLSWSIGINNSGLTGRRLFVDVSELIRRDAGTGIQRVVRNIIKEWIINPPKSYKVEPVYATERGCYLYARAFAEKFKGAATLSGGDEPIAYSAGDLFFVLDMQPEVQRAQASYYRHLREQGVEVKFMVYDLLCILQPEHFPKGAAENFFQWLKVVAESDGAICISQAVADELQGWMEAQEIPRLRPFKILANHLGADLDNGVPKDCLGVDKKIVPSQIKGSYSFLMVGTIEPRKGYNQVLDAFEYLWDTDGDVNLVIVGKVGWMVDTLVRRLRNHAELGKRLFWLDGISDDHLEMIYAESSCLIAASYGEGFGLPLIEAAQNKMPIICRDIKVFREVAGKHAFYFEANEGKELAESIINWLEMYKGGRHPKSDHMPWLTWKQSSQKLLIALGIQ